MKTMKQMQDEMLSRARFDGGWPRAVIVGFGCVALANNEEEYTQLVDDNHAAIRSALITAGTITAIIVLVLAMD